MVQYVHGMLGGLLDHDQMDIVLSIVWSRQLLAIKVNSITVKVPQSP